MLAVARGRKDAEPETLEAEERRLVFARWLHLLDQLGGATVVGGQFAKQGERVIMERISEWFAKSPSILPSAPTVLGSDTVKPSLSTAPQ